MPLLTLSKVGGNNQMVTWWWVRSGEIKVEECDCVREKMKKDGCHPVWIQVWEVTRTWVIFREGWPGRHMLSSVLHQLRKLYKDTTPWHSSCDWKRVWRKKYPHKQTHTYSLNHKTDSLAFRNSLGTFYFMYLDMTAASATGLKFSVTRPKITCKI